MKRFAVLTDAACLALLSGDHAQFSRLMDENYDLRASIYDRRCGVSAKFAGYGGAIAGCLQPDRLRGTHRGHETNRLRSLQAENCWLRVARPADCRLIGVVPAFERSPEPVFLTLRLRA